LQLPEAVAERQQAPSRSRSAQVVGLGVAIPDEVVGNAQIAAAIGVDEAWIERRTGIRSRRWAPPGTTLVDLAARSAAAALADGAVDGSEVDLVLLATLSQETTMPSLAPQVAAAVGATGAGAFDLGAACAGFVSGLATATAFIESGRAEHVLLVGADVLSRRTDPHDRRTAALFGDGAGAAVLSAAGGGGVSNIELGADGGAAELIVTDRETGFIRMEGHDTFKQAVARMEQATLSICARAELDPHADVDLFVFHQANARITRSLLERLQLPAEKVVDCIAELGNTSAASVPLALAHARDNGRLTSGSRVLVCAVGAGFIWGAALIDWGRS
jgi:3-oxoacyl-[acyl-carrier-protein] synthase-3